MARTRYATRGGDVAVRMDAVTGVLSLPAAASNPAPLAAFDAFDGGNPITDLALDATGSNPVSAAPAPTRENPQRVFYGPDGFEGNLYLQDANGLRWLVEPDVAPGSQDGGVGTIDESGLVHKADAEIITGVKTFSANPIFNDDAISTAKVSGLDEALQALSGNEVTLATMTAALTAEGRSVQADFLGSVTQAEMAAALGVARKVTGAKPSYTVDYTSGNVATLARPFGTDATVSIFWRGPGPTRPTNFLVGVDEWKIVS